MLVLIEWLFGIIFIEFLSIKLVGEVYFFKNLDIYQYCVLFKQVDIMLLLLFYKVNFYIWIESVYGEWY